MTEPLIPEWSAGFAALDPETRLARLRASVEGEIVFTTSFGLEDQALTHIIAGSGLDIAFATLDTGRLFPETYEVWSRTQARYGLRIRAILPQTRAVETLIDSDGVDGFRASIAARKACCAVRKIEPLGRALAGARAWVTGLRADQSAGRSALAFVARDAERGLVKVNPLLDWTRARVAAFVATHDVPVNPLHQRGFLSIGCAPCTRVVPPGEPERAGRWWWESEAQKECGLHLDAAGRLVRAAPAPEAAR